ncbi:hypothetical protein ABZX88_20550 [Kitasatospora aureofaciens]|uniref:hypothetical protein n=1 Tax=Kitasatospora aureofaciens TaxID=1894 RepID=UPI00052564A8|nr:hypothetical protein [Kitasatospora aureofaciens]HJD81833.1 hypothetical protein [Kitasatospora aureofaciens]
MSDADFSKSAATNQPSKRRRTPAELMERVENSPVRKDLTTGRLVEIVGAEDGRALVRPLFEPGAAVRQVPADQLTTRISLWR